MFGSSKAGWSTQLYRGVRAALFVRIFGVGMVFLVQMLLARWFGPEVFGEYIYVFTWITVLALIAKLGLDTATLRFVSAYAGLEQWGKLRGFLITSRVAGLLVSALAAAVGLLLLWMLGESSPPGLVRTFQLGFVLLPLMVLMQLNAAHLQALKRPGLAQVPQDIIRPVILVSGATLWVGMAIEPSASTVMGLEALATFVSLMFAWWVLAKHLVRNVGATPATYEVRGWLVASFPMLMTSGAQLILAKADIIMVGALMSPTEAGKYAVASLLAGLVTFLVGTANQVIAPAISQLFTQNLIEDLQRMVSISALAISALTLPLVIVLLVFGRDFLLLFGVEFADQYNVLTVLMIGQIVIVLWGSVGFLLTMTEYQVMASWVVGGSSILNIVLNFILIPQFGLIGAAAATSLTVSARSMVLGFFVWKKLNIMPTVFGPLLRRLS